MMTIMNKYECRRENINGGGTVNSTQDVASDFCEIQHGWLCL